MPNNQELSPVITEAKLLQFYNTYVKPYINAESGGHEIMNEGASSALTQRETMVLQAPLFAEDDSTNETTNLNVDVDADLSSFPVPGNTKAPDMQVYINNPSDGQSIIYNGTNQRWENGGGIQKYSTTEQIIGTWIDGKPVYEKIIDCGYASTSDPMNLTVAHNISNIDIVIQSFGSAKSVGGGGFPLPFNYKSGSTELIISSILFMPAFSSDVTALSASLTAALVH